TGWYSSPNLRGTIDILWTCLFTIFLCCWTAIHPTIPSPSATWKQTYLDRTIALLAGAIAPEIFIYEAFFERLEARTMYTEPPGDRELDPDEQKWSMVHRFYAKMGGFCVTWKHETDSTETVKYGYLDARQTHFLLHDGVIDLDTFITQNEIRDKGKADGIIKTFTLLQILWTLAQSIARRIQNMPLTTLEITTLAYIPCAVCVVFLWWNKPYDVGVPTQIRLDVNPHSELIITEKYNILPRTYKTFPMTYTCRATIKGALAPINRWGSISSAVFAIVGGIHLSAWNSTFPTPFEKWAWRICSLILATSIPISWILTRLVVCVYQTIALDSWLISRRERIAAVIQGFGVGLYAVARMYLLVEVFLTLRVAPPGVYDTPDWTMFLPHV
ncbi:hypothetical protein BCR34DRAFT_441792, partial [Clohesyomyces aquaticus]